MPPRVSEADRWRAQAHEALAKFTKAMEFFMWAAAQLVKLTEIHSPDDFNHCEACKAPWPCATIQVVRSISERWTVLQQESNES